MFFTFILSRSSLRSLLQSVKIQFSIKGSYCLYLTMLLKFHSVAKMFEGNSHYSIFQVSLPQLTMLKYCCKAGWIKVNIVLGVGRGMWRQTINLDAKWWSVPILLTSIVKRKEGCLLDWDSLLIFNYFFTLAYLLKRRFPVHTVQSLPCNVFESQTKECKY